MSEETTIYDKNGIKITNLRAVFGEKTYSVANITSVEAKTIPPSTGCAFTILVGGIIAIIIGISKAFPNTQSFGAHPDYSILILGILAIVSFVIMNRSAKNAYAVSLTTASGEVRAYESNDQQTIKTIVESLNTAIIQKG